jgi:hypothetical protein
VARIIPARHGRVRSHPPHWLHLPAAVAFEHTNSQPSPVAGWMRHSRQIGDWDSDPDPGSGLVGPRAWRAGGGSMISADRRAAASGSTQRTSVAMSAEVGVVSPAAAISIRTSTYGPSSQAIEGGDTAITRSWLRPRSDRSLLFRYALLRSDDGATSTSGRD